VYFRLVKMHARVLHGAQRLRQRGKPFGSLTAFAIRLSQ
jgi:hypothetical protein